MASKVCFRLHTFTFNSKMSPELLKPIYDGTRYLPRTHKRLITTLSSIASASENKIHRSATCILRPKASPNIEYNTVHSNILQAGTNRSLKTLSSLLSQGNLFT